MLNKAFYSILLRNFEDCHSVHWGINPPLKSAAPFSCQAPPLNQHTVQALPPFYAIPPLYWLFVNPP